MIELRIGISKADVINGRNRLRRIELDKRYEEKCEKARAENPGRIPPRTEIEIDVLIDPTIEIPTLTIYNPHGISVISIDS